MHRESWDYGEPVLVEHDGVIRRLEPVPWVVRPRRPRGLRLSRRWVWYPARTAQRLAEAGLILALALGGWVLMTWLSLRVLSWMGVRPW